MTLIGISGKKRAGKDLFASILKETSGLTVERLAFADALKEEVAAACGVPLDFIEKHKDQFRLGLQWWGTEFRRGLISDTYWLERFDDRYQVLRGFNPPPAIVVVPDVRFPNELAKIHQLGGIVVRVERGAPGADAHASETALDHANFDYLIRNDGTLEEFKEKVIAFWGEQVAQGRAA